MKTPRALPNRPSKALEDAVVMLAVAPPRAEQSRCLGCHRVLARVQNGARRYVTCVFRRSRSPNGWRAGQVVQRRSPLRPGRVLPTLNQIQVSRACPVHALDAARPRPSTRRNTPTGSGTPWLADVSLRAGLPYTTATTAR